ncbi:MAG: hypothetical protein HKN20_06665, partial [Gemmatimonadetes bacterium]|nr:hypothetical protein [Gemmatimonadota bacterium]
MMTDPIRSRGHSKAVWAGALLGLVVGLPFLGKAFHIDDTHVLSITAQILQEPLDPYGFSINWTDDPEPVFKTWNPPFLSYWLAPVVSLFGYSEPILHAAMLPFLAMLGAGCVVLARRFAGGDNPPAALGVAAFVLLSPALMPSVNLMLDVPALALSAAGAALFVTGSDAGSRKRLLTGAALASLAVLTKYSAATVLPALAVYSISFRRRPDAIALIPPITLALLWTWQNFAFHGESHFLHLIGGRTSEAWIRAWPEKGLLAIAIAGSCLFLAPVIAGRSGRAWGTGIAAGGLAVAAAHLWFGGWPGTLFAIGCALGAALLALAMATLLRRGDRRESIFLGTWLLLPFLFSVFFVPFQAVRHFLPWLVPLSLIAWRAAESTNRTLRVIILGAQALVAVIVSL